MQIRIDDIPAAGRVIEAGLETSWALRAVAEAMDAEPSHLKARFRVNGTDRSKQVRVELDIDVEAAGICDRCGEDVLVALHVASDLLYQPESSQPSDEEVELGEDDLDVGWYRGEHLSLPDILMEAVALELPSRVLCTDEEACEARTTAMLNASSEGGQGHPAFAALKNLKN